MIDWISAAAPLLVIVFIRAAFGLVDRAVKSKIDNSPSQIHSITFRVSKKYKILMRALFCVIAISMAAVSVGFSSSDPVFAATFLFVFGILAIGSFYHGVAMPAWETLEVTEDLIIYSRGPWRREVVFRRDQVGRVLVAHLHYLVIGKDSNTLAIIGVHFENPSMVLKALQPIGGNHPEL